jgi:hypothetical protein
MGHHYSGAVVGPAFGSKAIHMYYSGILLAGILVVIGSLATHVISTYASLSNIGEVYEVVVLFFAGLDGKPHHLSQGPDFNNSDVCFFCFGRGRCDGSFDKLLSLFDSRDRVGCKSHPFIFPWEDDLQMAANRE